MERQRRYSDHRSSSEDEDDEEYEEAVDDDYHSASDQYYDDEDDEDTLEDEEDEDDEDGMDDHEARPSRDNPVPKQRTVFPKELQESYLDKSKDFHGRSPPPVQHNKARRNDGRRYSDGESRNYDDDRGNCSDVPRRSDGEVRRHRHHQPPRDYDGRENKGHSDGETRRQRDQRYNYKGEPRRNNIEDRRQNVPPMRERMYTHRDHDDNRRYSDGEASGYGDKRVNFRDEPRRRDDSRYREPPPRGRRSPQDADIDGDNGYSPVRQHDQKKPKPGKPKKYPPYQRGPGMEGNPRQNERLRNHDSRIDYEYPQHPRRNVRGRVDREQLGDRNKKGHPHHQGRKGDFVHDYNQEHRPNNRQQQYHQRQQYPRNIGDRSLREDDRGMPYPPNRRMSLDNDYDPDYLDDHQYFPGKPLYEHEGYNESEIRKANIQLHHHHQEPWYPPLRKAMSFREELDQIPQDTLVNILLSERDFRATLLHLHEAFKLPLAPLRKLIASNGQMFRQIGEAVQLKINIKICSTHNGPNGCANRSTCNDLHICSKYAENKCKNDNCIMGHNWLTSRNIKIVNGLQLGNTSNEIIEKIMKLSVTSSSSNQIDVCLNYNNKGCRRQNCPKLHVCYSFIKGLSQCSRQNCQLNHDLLTSDCCRLLEAAGIDVNESPRDVLVALLDANPSLKKRAEKTERTDQQDPATTSDVDDNTSRENRDVRNKPKKIRTVWTYESKGDVDIEEICYDSVESRCNNESKGCQRLHALEHYHWQVSESGKSWINLQPHQVKSLELSFCDVNNDDCDVPRFDPQQLQRSHGALITLLGRATWLVDFKTMTMTDSKKTKTLKIRRLCTQTVPGNKVEASTFVWYFLDKQQNWVEYGEIDTLGAKDLVSSVTSADIEKQYLRGAPTMSFNNSQFTYIIDYKQMTQTNQNTNVAREVRRRPMVHLENEEDKEEEEEGNFRRLPSEWEKMQPNERLKRVTIAQTSDEYKKVVQLLGTTVPSPNVTKMERVQNRFHWNAFQNKTEEMSSIYGDNAKVDIRQLFHGTSHTVVQQICSENFDPRLHGQAAGQAYGQGTYFGRDASLSLGYCKADSSGQKYLFVAQVAVGSITIGNSSMARPPINPATKAPFDSTGDHATNPSIIVKYDKAEYYPQYILTLK